MRLLMVTRLPWAFVQYPRAREKPTERVWIFDHFPVYVCCWFRKGSMKIRVKVREGASFVQKRIKEAQVN